MIFLKNTITILFLITLTACSKKDNNDTVDDSGTNSEIGDPEIVLSVGNNSPIIFSNISGTVSNDYETGFTKNAYFTGQSADNKTLTISLVDNLEDDPFQVPQPFREGGSFPVGDTSLLIYATISYTDGSTTFDATSGLFTVTKYLTDDFGGDNLIIYHDDGSATDLEVLSGHITASDGTTTLTATLSNILLICGECGG